MLPGKLFIYLFGLLFLASLPAAADTLDIAIQSFDFVPGNQTISVGTTVRWTNQDAVPHTSTADDLSWDSGNLGNGQSWSLTFSEPGVFPYHCAIHPTMLDTLTVQIASRVPSMGPLSIGVLILLLILIGHFIYRRKPADN